MTSVPSLSLLFLHYQMLTFPVCDGPLEMPSHVNCPLIACIVYCSSPLIPFVCRGTALNRLRDADILNQLEGKMSRLERSHEIISGLTLFL